MLKVYKNCSEFFKANNLNEFGGAEEWNKCYETLVRALDYPTCKKILMAQLERDGITLEELGYRYKKDKHLNNIYKYIGGKWEWDNIGDRMLHNLNRCIHLQFISDSQKTCIAKAVAKMIIEENDIVDNL